MMVLLVKMIYQGFQRYSEENKEPLTENFFLLGSPLKVLAVTAAYWLFVMKIGPRVMASRPPYDMKNAMLVYNVIQIVINAYLAYLAVKTLAFNPSYSDWSCMRRTRPQLTFDELHGYYAYFILKVTDYMDTIFMVLRKRNRQITFLHVYHHIMMVLSAYYIVRYNLGGHSIMLGLLNASVHVVMYLYYFVSALSPDPNRSISWKKYITKMQLAQFIFLIIHFGRGILNPDCDESKPLMWFGLLQAAFMLCLFSDFYYKAYLRKPKGKDF